MPLDRDCEMMVAGSRKMNAAWDVNTGDVMNSEMKAERMEEIKKLEGLLAYAVQHNDEPEVERISEEGAWIVEGM